MSKETTSCGFSTTQDLRAVVRPVMRHHWIPALATPSLGEYLFLGLDPDQQILRGEFARKSPILLQIAPPAQILRA